MWKLKNVKKDHWEHFIFVGDDCIVGRKDASLLISNDPSISRRHAALFVRHLEENIGNSSKKSSLFMRDEGSKYGTFKNGEKVTSEVELMNGDIVKFGQFESEFRVHYIPLAVTTSCLDVPSKNKLKNCVYNLGGHLVSEWQPTCTHLVMSEVKVTVKALCCLVSLKPIVRPDFFEELFKSLKSSSTFLSPKEYLPPIGESLIDKDQVSFDVNPLRKNMFKNKTFLFLDEKQFKKLHLGIITGGGKASIINEKNTNIESLLTENTCVIEPIRSLAKAENSFMKEVISSLQKKKLRLIPESDVGLAVAYASTEKFCNPRFDVGSVVLSSPNIPSQTLSEREVYVPETQDRIETPSSSKRTLSSDSQQSNKKQKLEAPDSLSLTISKVGKNKAEEEFEISLSAQVKKELNSVFELDVIDVYDDKNNEIEELPATQPLNLEAEPSHSNNRLKTENISMKSPSPVVKEELSMNSSTNKRKISSIFDSPPHGSKDEPSTSMNRNKMVAEGIEKSPKKMKIERNTSAVNQNGFNNVLENGMDDNLPRNLIKIQYVDLVIRAPRTTAPLQNRDPNVKNFKKFKKVYPKKSSVLPRIIGGHDLIPYDKDAAKFQTDFDEEVDARNITTVKGAFDWDASNA